MPAATSSPPSRKCPPAACGSRDYLAGFRQPLAFANFALDDPLPALAEFPAAVLNRIGGLAGGRAKRSPRSLRQRLAK